MAEKAATLFVIDTGRTMGRRRNGRNESDLDYGMRYVWNKILADISTGRKTLNIGAIAFRNDATNNFMADDNHDEEYSNIAVLQSLKQMLLPDLQDLRRKIQPSNTEDGDLLASLAIAIETIDRFTKRLKYRRKIIVLTDGCGDIDPTGYEAISKRINELGIELVVIGIDFDDADYGFKEEEKPAQKAENEAFLKTLTDSCENSTLGTAVEAIESISTPTVKSTRPYKTYGGPLTLGDPSQYGEGAVLIQVERYFRTKVAPAPSASNFAINTDNSSQLDAQSSLMVTGDGQGPSLAAVKTMYSYRVTDETAPGGKKDVDREELARGYMYGSTIVPISASEENVTRLETLQGFEIVGFVPKQNHEPYLSMGPSCITIAQQSDVGSRIGLSSLVRAMYELEVYAVARIVMKDGKDPQLLMLSPLIEPDMDALIDVPLPFAEDVRTYKFAPLDHILTTAGSHIKTHRNLPSSDLTQAMSDFVDSMDLSAAAEDEDGQPREYMLIEEAFSPLLHRLNDAIQQRAINPDWPPTPPAEPLVRFAEPPAHVLAASQAQLEQLIATAEVKKVPPKVKGKRKDAVTPLSNLDVESLLRSNKRTKISENNSVPEFKQMLETTDDPQGINIAADQLSTIIRSLVTHSLGDSGYDRALENIRVMRDELIAYEEPDLYNKFITDLKKSLLDGELGGDRRELWWEIRKVELGLITNEESDVSAVTDVEAKEFYAQKVGILHRSKV